VGALPDIKLFPNPTDGIINVQNVPSVMENIIVVNVLGETVMELKNLDSQDFTLDLSKLTPGTYYVRFISAKSVTTKMALRN
jgi:hypothetical protein